MEDDPAKMEDDSRWRMNQDGGRFKMEDMIQDEG